MVAKLFIRYPEKLKRLIEISIPLLSWAIITMPVWLSFWHPAVVAYFVILFVIYWFYKSATMAVNAIRSYLTLSTHVKVNWLAIADKLPGFPKIHHVVIIPEYKEPLHILRKTLHNLTKQTFPLQKISIILATEKRDDQAQEISLILAKEFAGKFANFWVTKHELVPGEVAGKSSNMAFAGQWVMSQVKKLKWSLNLTTITSCDADAMLHPEYFAYLSAKFLADKERDYHFYQAGIMYYSNIWSVPLPGRVLNTIGSIYSLSLLYQGLRLINTSTYSLSLKTVAEVGFWGVDVIPEDYHLFFKTYFKKGERVKVVPIFLPILVQAALSTSQWKTLVNQYEQFKRWAWGVSDLPFVVRNYFTHSEISLWDRTIRLIHLFENHLVWPTNWFILTLGATLPPLINPAFARTVLGHNLSKISSLVLTISVVFLLVVIYLDAKSKPPRPQEFARWKLPFMYLQWFSLPLVSFFLFALPGLDAHTRLMLGKRLEYRVTEKV